MDDRPTGPELLHQARQTLLEDLLDCLPKDKRYSALMVANAMAIAARELEADRTVGLTAAEAEPLVTDLRAGAHDGDQALYDRLLSDTRDRVALSNPKRLA